MRQQLVRWGLAMPSTDGDLDRSGSRLECRNGQGEHGVRDVHPDICDEFELAIGNARWARP